MHVLRCLAWAPALCQSDCLPYCHCNRHSLIGIPKLQGGIEKYLQEFPEGGFWQGKNFVFDKREAIGAGCFEGVGGIVQVAKDKAGKTAAPAKQAEDKGVVAQDATGESAKAKIAAEPILGRCCACECPWDRYVGKKKCAMCGVPVLLCVACSSARGMLDKASAKDKDGEAGKDATAAATAAATGGCLCGLSVCSK